MRENYKEFFSSMMFILLLITTNVFAQQQQWAQRAGGANWDIGRGIAVDGSGNVYVIGSFQNSITFGGTTLTSAGDYDIFVAKYNSSGVVQWAQRAGGVAVDIGYDIAVDGSGNVYVTGYFVNSMTFGGTTLTSVGGRDMFVAKYNSSGVVQWAQRAGGTGTDSWDEGRKIAVDGSGNVYVTGLFEGSATATFGGTTLTSAGQADIFVAKYDNSGVVQWAQRAGGTGWDVGAGVAVDGSGDVYVTGLFRDSATFGSTTFTSAGGSDIFVAKYNSSGAVQWAQHNGGAGWDVGSAIAVDGSGNVYVTGYFGGNVTFGGTTLTSAGQEDIFVAKYNNSGVVQWAQRAGGTGLDYGNSIAVDVSGNVYVTGSFQSSATFGGTTLTSAGEDEIFVAKYDNSGVVEWAERAGATGWDYGNGIAVDGSRNLYVTGNFQSSATFGGTTLTSAGLSDIFVVKYAVATITSLSPTSTTATASAFPLTINGFLSGATTLTISVLDSQGVPTGTLNLLPFITSSSATQIVVNLPAGVAATVGTLTVTLSALSGTTTAVFLVQGDNIIVTTNANDGGGSLRRAFQLTSTGGTIHIQGHVGAVQLTGGPIGVTRQVNLVDTNGGLEINGNGNSIFDVQCGGSLYLENVILTGSGNNPAIRNDCGTVILRRSRVTGN